MIHDLLVGDIPGSIFPDMEILPPRDAHIKQEIEEYLEEEHYVYGRSVVIRGPKLSGVTSTGFYIVHHIYEREPEDTRFTWCYWKERDFLEDTRECWKRSALSEKMYWDEGIWDAHKHFKQRFDICCGVAMLFLDNAGQGNHSSWYHTELDGLLQERSDRGKVTMLGVDPELWNELPIRIQHGFADALWIDL